MSNLTRRHFLQGTLAATAVGSVGSQLPATPAYGVGGKPFVAYKSTSYFRKRADHNRADRQRTAQFRTFMRNHPDQRGHAYPKINGVGGNQWGTAYAMSSRRDPIWTLTGNIPAECSRLRTKGFHAPLWLVSMFTGTNDSPFCVIDRGSGFTVFGANAKQVGVRTISVSSVGITFHSSNGLHRKNPRSDDDRNFTSRGRISDAMVIRKDLVKHGIAHSTGLGHVLQLFLVETRSSDGFRHPMVAAENGQGGFGAEGERIVVKRSVDLTRRGLSPAGLVIARTLKRHGCYFGDNSGTQSCLKAEQSNAIRPLWGGLLGENALRGLHWDDFVVLR